jgi:hypothetical protein
MPPQAIFPYHQLSILKELEWLRWNWVKFLFLKKKELGQNLGHFSLTPERRSKAFNK